MKEYFKEKDRDAQGEWHPQKVIQMSCPLFLHPLKLGAFLRWFFLEFAWPQHIHYTILAFISWYWLTPSLETMQTLHWRWIGLLFLRTQALIWLFYGGYHLLLYRLKLQGSERKYHPKWQVKDSKMFLFRNQVYDNVFRTAVTGGIIWTAYEVLYFWLLAKGVLPTLSWATNPVWFVSLFVLVPFWRDFHFYCIHRLIHWGPFMRHVHGVHHRNSNPGPWSGMAMHWFEQLLYLSVVLIHFVVPTSPIHFLYNSQLTGLTPSSGHHGFEPPFLKGLGQVGAYEHYLHHRHFSCNYGIGFLPLDRIFKSFYDGTIPFREFKKKKQKAV